MNDNVEEMQAEFAAWHNTGHELRKIGFEAYGWDDPQLKLFHAAVVLWGERLVSLRNTQTSEVCDTALNDAEKAYSRAIKSLIDY